MKYLAGLIPPSRNGRVLAVGGTIDSVGSGLFMAASTLYFVQIIGFPPVAIGVALALGAVCGLLTPIPLGLLADRIGAKRVFVALLCVRAVGYASFGLIGDLPPYVLLTCILVAADSASAPLFQAVVGQAVPDAERSATMSSIRAVRNLGLGVGFLLAAGTQALNWVPAFYILFILNGLSFLGTGFAIRRMRLGRLEQDEHDASASPQALISSRPPHLNRSFIGLVGANTLVMLHDSLLLVLLPLWVVEVLDLPASFASVLLAVSTVQTALTQAYVGRFTQGLKASVRGIRAGCGLLILTCMIFGFASGLSGNSAVIAALIGLIFLTLAENLLAAANWEASYLLSPSDRRSQYLAFFSLGFSGQRVIGPLIMTAVVLPTGVVGWSLLGVLFALGAGATSVATRSDRRA